MTAHQVLENSLLIMLLGGLGAFIAYNMVWDKHRELFNEDPTERLKITVGTLGFLLFPLVYALVLLVLIFGALRLIFYILKASPSGLRELGRFIRLVIKGKQSEKAPSNGPYR